MTVNINTGNQREIMDNRLKTELNVIRNKALDNAQATCRDDCVNALATLSKACADANEEHQDGLAKLAWQERRINT